MVPPLLVHLACTLPNIEPNQSQGQLGHFVRDEYHRWEFALLGLVFRYPFLVRDFKTL